MRRPGVTFAMVLSFVGAGSGACADLWGEQVLSSPPSTDAGASSHPDAPPSTDAGGSLPPDAGLGLSPACPGGEIPVSGCDQPPTEPYAGVVSFEYSVGVGITDGGTSGAYGEFVATVDAASPPICQVMGDCCLATARGGPSTPAGVSAGVITLDDGTLALATLDPTDGGDAMGALNPGIYYPGSAAVRWNAGDMLRVQATGGAIDPFQGSVVAPAPVTGLDPAFDKTSFPDGYQLPTSIDLYVTWDPGPPGGQIFFYLDPLTQSGIFCIADDHAGNLTVPAALLGTLPKGQDGYVNISRMVQAVAPSSNATIIVSAQTSIQGLATWTN